MPKRDWGSFRFHEIQGVRGKLGLTVERDLHFRRRQRFSELKGGRKGGAF